MADKPTPKDDVISDLSAFMEDFKENVRVDDDIPYPIEVKKVIPPSKVSREMIPVGSWCAIRPVKENKEEKTYLGIFLGELPIKSATTSYNLKNKELTFLVASNPAIYVPDLKKIVWGYESWWGRIKNPEDLKKITDQGIENIWYVKAMREMLGEKSGEKPPSAQSS